MKSRNTLYINIAHTSAQNVVAKYEAIKAQEAKIEVYPLSRTTLIFRGVH